MEQVDPQHSLRAQNRIRIIEARIRALVALWLREVAR